MSEDTAQDASSDFTNAGPWSAAYRLTQSDLRAGDILLFRPTKRKLHQAAISALTRSPYTHTAIYLGEGEIAESNFPQGVNIKQLAHVLTPDDCVGVLRSQIGFGADRIGRLREFARAVAGTQPYDSKGALRYSKAHQEYWDSQLAVLEANYGKIASAEDYKKRRYFCSSFVVACYAVVGLIGPTAQVVYPEHVFAPGDLYQDSTFGWLLGYLVSEGVSISDDDPLFVTATRWPENISAKWW